MMDKLYHFIAGAVIFWVANYFMSYAIIPVIAIAILKEVYDLKVKKSRMDFWDILATIAGGIAVYIFTWIDVLVVM